MATITPLACSRTGAVIDYTNAAAAGDQWLNTGKEVLLVHNADSGSHTVSVTTQATPDGKTVTDRTVTIAAGAYTIIGPFPVNVFNDVAGYAHIVYSATTSMKIQVATVPNN